MKNVTLRILAVVVLLAAIAGIAVLAYNAGTAHQVTISNPSGTQNPGTVYPIYGWWPFPFFGFGFFGLIAAFFLFSLVFHALRLLFWGPRWGWRRWHRGYGYWGERGEGEEPPIPPMMAEMHRRMHAAEQDKPAGTTTES